LGEEIRGSYDAFIARLLYVLLIKKREGKFIVVHAMKECGEWKYICNKSCTWNNMEEIVQLQAPAALHPTE
jgi:hypothetical protein